MDFILQGINEYLLALAKEQIQIAFAQAEKEVTDLHQRTKEGLVTAKLNGKQAVAQKAAATRQEKQLLPRKSLQRTAKLLAGRLMMGSAFG